MFELGESLSHKVLHLAEQFETSVSVVTGEQFNNAGNDLSLILGSIEILPNLEHRSEDRTSCVPVFERIDQLG